MVDRSPDHTTADRLLSLQFVGLGLSSLCYYFALALTTTVLPIYVVDHLDGGGVAVGVAMGSLGVAAVVARLFVGTAGDAAGRRTLVVAGSLIAGMGMLLLTVAESVPVVAACRLLTGAGEAAAAVGIATAMQDLVPANRRTEAAIYYALTLSVSFGAGAPVAEWLRPRVDFDLIWLAAAAITAIATLLGLLAPAHRPSQAQYRFRPAIVRSSVGPALVLFLAMVSFSAFIAFVVLRARDVGISQPGLAFSAYAAVSIVARVGVGRFADRIGPRRLTTYALAITAVGLAVIGGWATPSGVLVGAAVLGASHPLIFPATIAVSYGRAGSEERTAAVATATMALDAGIAVGAIAWGGAVSLIGLPAPFLLGAGLCAITILVAQPLLDEAPNPALPE